MKTQLKLAVIVYGDFELLDLFGPLEMFSFLKDELSVTLISENGKTAKSYQGTTILVDSDFLDETIYDIVFIPGGMGTRSEVNNKELINFIKTKSLQAKYVLTVCTGSALLAKTDLLNGVNATTNKLAYDWVTNLNKNILWQSKARWVEDGKYFTSSGVSAGTDMALAFIQKIFGSSKAEYAAKMSEYIWNSNPLNDPFAE